MKLSRSNQFPGKCCICSAQVPSQRGFLLEGRKTIVVALKSKKWVTVCTARACAEKVAGKEEVAQSDRRELLADGTLHCPVTEETQPLIEAIGYPYVDGWRATLRHRDRAAVLLVADALGLSVDPSLREYEDPKPVRLAVDRARAAGARDYQIAGVRWVAYRGLLTGESAQERGMREEKDHPHFTKRGVDRRRGGALCDDPGLGKTLQVLFGLHDDEALVVICPKNAKAVWPKEALKWRPERFDKITICEGVDGFAWPKDVRELVVVNYDVLPPTPALIKAEHAKLLAKRDGSEGDPSASRKADREDVVGLKQQRAAWEEEEALLLGEGAALTTAGRHDIYLSRCELVELDAKLERVRQALERNAKLKPVGKPPCNVFLVADEAHYVQNNKAGRTVKWGFLAKRARRIVGTTGTPVESEPRLLWGFLQAMCTNPFEWEGFKRQFSGFRPAWGGTDYLREAPAVDSTARGAVKVLPGTTEILATALLYRRKADVAKELPPKIYSEIPVELSTAMLKKLDSITVESMELLMQGGLPPFDIMSTVSKTLARASIPAMLEEIEKYEDANEPLVVFSAHRDPIEKLVKRKGWATISGGRSTLNGRTVKDRGEIEDAFQRGELRGVAGTEAMAEAMTLTHASTILRVDTSWKHHKNEQVSDRVHRLGQTQTVHIITLVPDHALPRHRAAVLAAKAQFKSTVLHGEGEFIAPARRFTDSPEREALLAIARAKSL